MRSPGSAANRSASYASLLAIAAPASAAAVRTSSRVRSRPTSGPYLTRTSGGNSASAGAITARSYSVVTQTVNAMGPPFLVRNYTTPSAPGSPRARASAPGCGPSNGSIKSQECGGDTLYMSTP